MISNRTKTSIRAFCSEFDGGQGRLITGEPFRITADGEWAIRIGFTRVVRSQGIVSFIGRILRMTTGEPLSDASAVAFVLMARKGALSESVMDELRAASIADFIEASRIGARLRSRTRIRKRP